MTPPTPRRADDALLHAAWIHHCRRPPVLYGDPQHAESLFSRVHLVPWAVVRPPLNELGGFCFLVGAQTGMPFGHLGQYPLHHASLSSLVALNQLRHLVLI